MNRELYLKIMKKDIADKGVSLAFLGRKTGVTRQWVSYFLQGRIKGQSKTVKKFYKILREYIDSYKYKEIPEEYFNNKKGGQND